MPWHPVRGLMAQVPPPPRQPPHQQLPPLLGPQASQEAVSPLPHKVRRVVCVSGTAADLHAGKGRRCGDLGHDVERLRGRSEGRGGCAGRGEGRGHGGCGGEYGAAGVEERHVAGPGAVVSIVEHVAVVVVVVFAAAAAAAVGGESRTVAQWRA